MPSRLRLSWGMKTLKLFLLPVLESLDSAGRSSVMPSSLSRPSSKTARRCPWQNPFVERYGGTLRRELLDHVMVLNEEHLKRLLREFVEEYYHRARPHQGLHGDAPVPSAKPEPVADASRLVSIPVVGGLHPATSAWPPNLLLYQTTTK